MREKIYQIQNNGENVGRAAHIYNYFMTVCIVISIMPLCFKTANLLFWCTNSITAAIFVIDYILRWATADYKYGKHELKSFLRYPFSLYAIIDLLSILPYLNVLNPSFKVLRVMRMGKALKAFRLLRHSRSFVVIMAVIKKERHALLAVAGLAISWLLLTGLVMFQLEPQTFDNFFDAVYWSLITLTTVGYGDITPVTLVGKAITVFSSFIGIAIIALPTGVITAGYSSAVEEYKAKKQAEENK